MESFLQRMSSLVTGNSNKFIKEDTDEIENDQQRKFSYLQQRRCSAPDIRRRGVTMDRLARVLDHKGTSEEQITNHFTSNIFPRKHYNSIGKLGVIGFYITIDKNKTKYYHFVNIQQHNNNYNRSNLAVD
ncbi:unnamed protein product [Rotaria magnacalcarata]